MNTISKSKQTFEYNEFSKVLDYIRVPKILKLLRAANNFEVFSTEVIATQLFLQIENPKTFFSDPETIFIDPACKSGILPFFAASLYFIYLERFGWYEKKGVQYNLCDPETRINFILQHNVYAFGISEYNAELTRNILYGVSEIGIDVDSRMTHDGASINTFFNQNIFKKNGKFKKEGNIYFPSKAVKKQHKLDSKSPLKKLKIKATYIENYQPFLEDDFYGHKGMKKLMNMKEYQMKKTLVVSNPPYTVAEDGTIKSTKNLYDKFVSKLRKYPLYGSIFVIPSKWMTNDGKGITPFLNEMRNAKNLKNIIDIKDAVSVFPTTDIKGGVCILNFTNKVEDGTIYEEVIIEENKVVETKAIRKNLLDLKIVVRDTEKLHAFASEIIKKYDTNMDTVVKTYNPFMIRANYSDYTEKKTKKNNIKLLFKQGKYGFIPQSIITKNIDLIDQYKLVIPKAIGTGRDDSTLNKYSIIGPNEIVSETFLVIFNSYTATEVENCKNYMNLTIIRILLEILKSTHNMSPSTFSMVPAIDFSKKSDEYTEDAINKSMGYSNTEISFLAELIIPKKVETKD